MKSGARRVETGSRTRVAPKATVKRCSRKRPVSRPSTVYQNRSFIDVSHTPRLSGTIGRISAVAGHPAHCSPRPSTFRERESDAFLTATELVLFPAITGTRRVAIGPRVPFGARRRSRASPKRGATWRRAALRRVSRNPPVHLWEHLLVSPDHGNDDGMPKVVEFLIIHVVA